MDDDPWPTDRASIVYAPTKAWAEGQRCPGCHAQPDKSLLYNGTWHDTTDDGDTDIENTTMTISFVGSGVYLYGVLDNNNTALTGTMANYDFILDGTYDGNFHHDPDNSSSVAYIYDVLFYKVTDLVDEAHELVVNIAGGNGVEQASLMLFDYFTVTYDSDEEESLLSSKTPSSTNPSGKTATVTGTSTAPSRSDAAAETKNRHTGATVGAIVGGALGGLALVAFALVFILCMRKRRRARQPKKEPQYTQPFLAHLKAQEAGSTSRTELIIPPMKLSPLRSSPNVTSPSSSSRARSDIDKRVRDMEARVMALRSRSVRASQRPRAATGQHPSSPPHDPWNDAEAPALRRQVDDLQAEIARLRAEQQRQTMVEPPPAYSTARNSAM
ncbi:hypothetical protein K523DRAFT_417808 [Schizophyllum commune Tattone D]|nr:hypothetical protein K523DRAFT_417808 [Schizophyllum commune Tattone D]